MTNARLASVLADALKAAHWVLEGTMADVTDEIVNRLPAGQANPIGAAYMHVLFSEDWLINRPKIRNTPTLFSTTWAGKTGADRLEPGPGAEMAAWYRSVQVDLAQARLYARAVYEMSEAWVASLSEDELMRVLGDLGPLGKQTIAAWIGFFLTGHCNSLAGEISAIKGTFGLKGYPF